MVSKLGKLAYIDTTSHLIDCFHLHGKNMLKQNHRTESYGHILVMLTTQDKIKIYLKKKLTTFSNTTNHYETKRKH